MKEAVYYFWPHLKRILKVIKLMYESWLETSLLCFVCWTSLICLVWDSAASSLSLCSAVSVKVRWDEIWILNFYWLVSPKTRTACLNKQVSKEERKPKGLGDWGSNLRQRNTYVHRDVPSHVDVGFVFIHPHLSSSQSIALCVVIDVIVVGLLGALDVGYPGTWQDFHTPSTLPHLDHSKKRKNPI